MKIGDDFIPYRLFTGVFIPEALVREKGISHGAKIAYGRLVRYGGERGECFPSVATLAEEIGVSKRQAQYYLVELEKAGFIRKVIRKTPHGQTSNLYRFTLHRTLFQALHPPMQDPASPPMQDFARAPMQNVAYEESHIEESQVRESIKEKTAKQSETVRQEPVKVFSSKEEPKNQDWDSDPEWQAFLAQDAARAAEYKRKREEFQAWQRLQFT